VSFWHAVAILAAALAAGAINAIVGSGTLLTFPTLVALGYPPVLANVSNTVGLVPGSAAAVWSYRRELAGQGGRLAQLCPITTVGALAGGTLLLTLPAGTFRVIVVPLIVGACLLVAVQPQLTAALARRPGRTGARGVAMAGGVAATGVYGGYFGAGQGVLLIGVLATMSGEADLQRVIAAKNVLAWTANAVAAVLFLTVHHVDGWVAGLIAAGSITGGLIGGRFGRRMSAPVLRAVVVAVGVFAVVRLLT